MTIQGSANLQMGHLCTEYGVAVANAYLSQFHRGHASKYVRANSGDNAAVNGSAGVPATYVNLQIAHFAGQAKGWTYTNSVVRINNYYPHGEFGSDWLGANGTGWPCTFINNNGIYSQGTSWYACIIYGRQNNGSFLFQNNSEIQGGGGAPNSGAGQHAIYLYNSENASYDNRPIIHNHGAIRGGGGAGGVGGTGGTGGPGYYDTPYTAQEGPAYDKSTYRWMTDSGGTDTAIWAGTLVGSATTLANPFANGAYTYYRHTLREQNSYGGGSPGPHEPPNPTYWKSYYEIYRQYTAYSRTITSGGGGGAGGNGGRGIGYNSPNQGGSGGSPGAGGQAYAGSGGYGGTGGTGGSWGAVGNTGNTGATGNGGNYGGGYGGAAGAGGGAAGYSIYAASKWGYWSPGTNNGPYGGGVANS
jgi:hypothetical protein